MGSKKTTTTTTRDVPEHVERAAQTAVNLGTSIANRPYQGYEGERFAPLSANERAASNLAAAGSGQTQGYIDKSVDALTGIKSFPESDISVYENPHVDAVESGVMRNLNAAAGRTSRNLASRSAGGGSGDLLRQSAVQRQHMQSISDASSSIRSKAYSEALGAWQNDQNAKMRAAEAWRATAGDVSRMNSQQIRDLMLTGEAARVVQQLDKDFQYQQWVEARDWDVNNLGPLLESLQVPYETTETTVKKSKGGFGQILGVAALAAGAVLTGGAALGVGMAGMSATTAGAVGSGLMAGGTAVSGK